MELKCLVLEQLCLVLDCPPPQDTLDQVVLTQRGLSLWNRVIVQGAGKGIRPP